MEIVNIEAEVFEEMNIALNSLIQIAKIEMNLFVRDWMNG